MRAEIELLLDCSRSRMDAERAVRIMTWVQAGLDWPMILSRARRHRLMPLLCWQLQAICPESIPGQVLEQLQREFQANAQRNLLLAGELLKLLYAFKQVGVEAMPLKGPALAVSAYGNLSLRQFIDLDVVVCPSDVLRAKDALAANEYHPVDVLTPAREQSFLQSESHSYEFLREDRKVSVDVHWAISQRWYSFPLTTDTLWSDPRQIDFLGTRISSPPPELLLLILCAHGSRHYWERLIWVCDVAELIQSQPHLNWERVWEHARLLRSERMLLTGLILAKKLLGTRLPAEAANRIEADPVAQALAAKVERWLFLAADSLWITLQKRLFILQVRECWRDKFAYVRHLLVWSITPNELDRAFLPLPGACSVFYYLLRPVRLVARCLGLSRKKSAVATVGNR